MQTRPTQLQLIVKSLIALLVTAVVTAIAVGNLYVVSAQQPEGFPIVFLFAFAFTAAHTFILGGPLLLVAAWRHAIRWWSSVLVGALVGFIPSALIAGSDFFSAWPMGLFGAIGGLTFWLMWRFWVQRMPARAAAPPV